MSDLAIQVRLTADGSQMVGQLSAAEIEAAKLTVALKGAGAAGTAAAVGTAEAGAAATQAAAGAQAMAAATKTAGNDLLGLQSSAAALRSALDPMFAAQQRFDQELSTAETLLKANAITQREYAAAIELARGSLQAHAHVATGAAAADERVAAASRAAAAASKQAAAELLGVQSSAAALRSALDPMFAAQQRFDQELSTAETLLKANAITQREYAAAVQLARDGLHLHANAVAGDGTVLRKHQQAVNSSTVSLGAQRAGYQQLGAQVQDTFVQFNAGTSILQILSQQGPQVASALSLAGTAADGTGSKVARLATFFAGPWGAAVFGAATVVGFLVKSLIESGDESEKAERKTYDFAGGLDLTTLKAGEARDALKQLADETKNLIRVQGEYLDQQALIARQGVAESERQLNDARKKLAAVDRLRPAGAAGYLYDQINGRGDLVKARDDAAASLQSSQQAVTNTQIATSQRSVNEALDAGAKLQGEYNRKVGQLEQLRREYDRSVGPGGIPLGDARPYIDQATYEKRFGELTRKLDSDKKALADRQAAERKTGRGAKDRSDLSSDTGSRILATAQSFNGLTERRDGGALKALFGEANLKIDPAMTAWCAAFVNAVLGKESLPTNGSLAARSFLNYGKAVDRPEKGDIVVLRRGNDETKGHVGFYAGEAPGGRILVTGGNQGKDGRVSTSAQKRSDVLAYRRAPTADQADREADRLQGVGDKARDAIGGLLAGFSDAPSQVTKTVEALKKFDNIIADLTKEQPPGFEGLIESAKAGKVAIADELGEAIADAVKPFEQVPADLAKAEAATKTLDGALKTIADNRPLLEGLLGKDGVAALEAQVTSAGQTVSRSLGQPFRDILRDQTQSLEVQRLQGQGRDVEAQQLAFLQDLMRQYNATSAEGLAIELAKRGTTAEELKAKLALFAQEKALSIEAAKRQDIERQHLGEVDRLRGNIERTIEDLPQRGIKVLGDFGRELQGQFRSYLARYLTETLFGGAFKQLERQLTGQDQVAQANLAYVGQVGKVVDALGDLEQAAKDAADAQSEPTNIAPDGTIIVNGQKQDGGEAGLRDPFNLKLKSPRELFGEIFKGVLADGFKLNDNLAGKIGDKVAGALQGAATGSTAASILLGRKANKTGAAIGGGLGQLAGESLGGALGSLGKFAGPFGAIAGGILGSVVGNLLTKPKFGAASLTSATDKVEATGRGAAEIAAAKGAGGSVQDGLKRVSEALGGQLGSFAVTIGTYKDKFRVNTTGSSTVGGSKGSVAGLKDFGDDEAGAIAYAITDAIGDGAIKGVSAAVQKALRSSGDLEAAIVEALKVKDLEEVLGGITGALQRQFRTFEAQAKERLRIATQYGFDVVEVERRNGEDRAKLVDQIVAERVGGLKDLLADLTSGSLAEGSAAEKRRSLLGEIADTEAKAKAGEDGAAKRLADLNRRLVETSREAFGTAGDEYGSDRAAATASAERVIQLEGERVKAAQDAAAQQAAELVKGNALANEGNDLAAQSLAELRRIASAPAATGGGVGVGGFSTARQVDLR